MHPTRYLPRTLPHRLQALAELALDLRWNWHHGADRTWQLVDAELWRATGNPWLILETVSSEQLESLAADSAFLTELTRQLQARQQHMRAQTWFTTQGTRFTGNVAYFSMEFGLSEALPIYSGGLGVLAGDHLKTACDLGVPVVGIGLLYQQGYFRQSLDAHGEQLEFYPYNDPGMMPVIPVRNAAGEWEHVSVDLPGRVLRLRAWQAQVGRRVLYLLDSNHPLNEPKDRGITGSLYGGGSELRLQQEIVLGIGGWRLLRQLELDCPVCHLNEGHAAFATLERIAEYMSATGQTFDVALCVTRAGNLFTTHTPVEAGFDRFAPELFTQYFHDYAQRLGIAIDHLLGLGRANSHDARETFNMAYLAVRTSGAINGVSRLHGAVSRRIFQPLFERWPQHEVPVGHVTNGVHMPYWDSEIADELWTEACGKSRWLGATEALEADFRHVDDKTLWRFRCDHRRRLIAALQGRLEHQHAGLGPEAHRASSDSASLNPDTLTLGFARRFATYKRPDLLLHDPDRLSALLANRDRPVQLVLAGKAHPQDAEGKAMIRRWTRFLISAEARGRVFFFEDYDLALAALLVQGVDVWINTPRRPWEASGTSGMKVLVNGGLNLSELDGWWAEAYQPELGWALGDGREHPEDATLDAVEADALYRVLEQEVVPDFYARDDRGFPVAWLARVRESMARLTPQFSSNRMLREYTLSHYVPLADAYRDRAANGGHVGAELNEWRARLRQHWSRLRFGEASSVETDGRRVWHVQVYLGELDPSAIEVELFADALSSTAPTRIPMKRDAVVPGARNAYVYTAEHSAERPASDYTPRMLARHPKARVPLEAEWILWLH